MKTWKIISGLFLVVVLAVLLAQTGMADVPDDIRNYTVDVQPASDGSLSMKYSFDYCATTDFPAGKAYLEFGVPNSNFTLVDWGPKDFVTGASTSRSPEPQVHLDFARLPRTGDCFSVNFAIRQQAVAHVKGDEVSFQFIPGWFSFAKISHLVISWHLPADAGQIHVLDPAPIRREGGQAIWEANNLAPNQKFTVNLLFAKQAFSDYKEVAAASGQEGGNNTGALDCIVTIVIILILLVIFLSVLSAIFHDGYSGGGYIGSGGGTWFPTGGYSGGGSSTGSGHGGGSVFSGGSGGFSGRGLSSSCVSSCACACACAGGGRAGCSRKGFNIRRLIERAQLLHPKRSQEGR
jgi:hypothetical protein